MNGQTSIEKVIYEIPDISELIYFGFYDRCWYWENSGLGETLRIGYWHNWAQLFLVRVTHLESQTSDNKGLFHLLDAAIARRFNEEIVETEGAKPNPESWSEIIGDDPDLAE